MDLVVECGEPIEHANYAKVCEFELDWVQTQSCLPPAPPPRVMYKNHETESHCACRVHRVISLGDHPSEISTCVSKCAEFVIFT